METIRAAEALIGDMVSDGKVKCPCHLGIGQEAIAVGVSSALRATDRVFGGHRSHSHYLAMGASLEGLFAEVLGKVAGCSKGMGGSMHLIAQEQGFLGSVPIVGATIPIAVGAALAARKDGSGDVAVAYFGDGASEEGILHESLNFASNFKLPVIFVCENNLYSSHLDIKLRQPSDLISRFALAHHVKAFVADGNDIAAVSLVSEALIQRARAGEGPGFIEAVTYRWRGHVGPNEDIDVGVRRTPGDLAKWKKRDPIRRLVESIAENKIATQAECDAVGSEARRKAQIALRAAMAGGYPRDSALFDTVYPGAL